MSLHEPSVLLHKCLLSPALGGFAPIVCLCQRHTCHTSPCQDPRVCPHWAPKQHKAPWVGALGAHPAHAGALSAEEQPSKVQSIMELRGAYRAIEVTRQPALAAARKQDPSSALSHSPPVDLWKRPTPGKNEGSSIWTVP